MAVRIAGDVVHTAFHGDGRPYHEMFAEFEFHLGGKAWQCRTTFGADHYEEVAFDGTYVYHHLVMPDSGIEQPTPVLTHKVPLSPCPLSPRGESAMEPWRGARGMLSPPGFGHRAWRPATSRVTWNLDSKPHATRTPFHAKLGEACKWGNLSYDFP
jgi:hypothetical protein